MMDSWFKPLCSGKARVMDLAVFINFISLIHFSACSVRPHIIFILADDLGWNDVGFHGMTQIPTPNIDALAGDSIILNNYYVCPLCTPSRASLLTGLYPSHTGFQHLVIQDGEATGLPLNLVILPQRLSTLGYENHMVGKWHLGFHHENFTPTRRGFKSHFGLWGSHIDYLDHKSIVEYDKSYVSGIPESNDKERIIFSGVDLHDNMKPATRHNGRYFTDVVTRKSINVIRNHNNSKPLFLYVAHLSVHRGNYVRNITSTKKYTDQFHYINDTNRRQFAGHLAALDKSVGVIMKNLHGRNMLKDSIVIFASDNGADVTSRVKNYGSNWPLRGQKFSAWEGGVRAAAYIWSPLLKSSPRISNQMMHITDWLPTLFSAAGGNLKDLGHIDGIDMWETLNDARPSPREEILLALDPVWNASALRYKQYKLVTTSANTSRFDARESNSRRDVLPLDFPRKKRSMTQRTLHRFYIQHGGKPSSVVPIINVVCGTPNVTTPCEKNKELCLFNIDVDPCEITDLSASLPEVVKEMLEKLETYKKSAVPHLKKGVDYQANPVLHEGKWTTWIKSL